MRTIVGTLRLTAPERSAKASPKEPRKHLLGTNLVVEHAATPLARRACATKPRERVLGLRAGALEPGLRVGAEAVVAFALLLVAEDGEGLGDHLEGLIGVLVAVLIRVCQQALLAVGLLDVAVAARLAHGLEVEDFVEGRHLAPPDPQHSGLLLGRTPAALVPLVVLPRARPVAVAGISAGGFGARHGGMERRRSDRCALGRPFCLFEQTGGARFVRVSNRKSWRMKIGSELAWCNGNT